MEALFDSTRLHGIDVSAFAEPADWGALREQSVTFAFIECARGTEKGRYFSEQWNRCAVAGIRKGAYQRLFSHAPGADQAEAFVAAFRGQSPRLAPDDLPPALDAEYDDDRDTMHTDRAGFTKLLRSWIAVVQRAFKRLPILYTSWRFWHEFMAEAEEFSRLPLWIAHYGVTKPQLPQAWHNYTFWQHAKEKCIEGFSPTVDLDIFNGSESDLSNFILGSRTGCLPSFIPPRNASNFQAPGPGR
ncbi:MAG: hypothetical protein JO233_01915 [Candidatus Eremiobacteraeota bacterium]|nr:hypothetical protein [Candidatus Eremiobacteraeota bacterium]